MSNENPIVTVNNQAWEKADQLASIADLKAQLTALTSQLESVVAENAALLKFIKDDCYVYTNDSCEPVDANTRQPKTPATDAFLAEVRASGVEMAANMLNHNHPLMSEAAEAILSHATQLRQGGAV